MQPWNLEPRRQSPMKPAALQPWKLNEAKKMAKRNNDNTNSLIKLMVMVGDVLILNLLIALFYWKHPELRSWDLRRAEVLWVVYNLALVAAFWRYSSITQLRIVSGSDILKRVFGLVVRETVIAYLIMKMIDVHQPVGWLIVSISACQMVILPIARLLERTLIKRFRQMGRNTRTVTFVGNDPELDTLYEKLIKNPTLGYRFNGYYGQPTEDSGAVRNGAELLRNADATIRCRYENVDVNGNENENENENDNVNGNGNSGAVSETQTSDISPQPSALSPQPSTDNGKPRFLGTIDELMEAVERDEELDLGEELYVCLSKSKRHILVALSDYCDRHMVRFFFVMRSVDRIGIRLRKEFIDDFEVFTTHEMPLDSLANRALKRIFDIVVSIIALVGLLLLLPIIIVFILIQSPGRIVFRQERTGINGKSFVCYKFRSMHVNKDSDKRQATPDDPRRFPFGKFMRKYNIDELPQFWNVLKGDMSVVGPRPHMLLHTDIYRKKIGNYMVRHFVKPGITGWAQVTGFRGETSELWQMEGRVKRDIWYIEHWSIWLDFLIIWKTIKSVFVGDSNAY